MSSINLYLIYKDDSNINEILCIKFLQERFCLHLNHSIVVIFSIKYLTLYKILFQN